MKIKDFLIIVGCVILTLSYLFITVDYDAKLIDVIFNPNVYLGHCYIGNSSPVVQFWNPRTLTAVPCISGFFMFYSVPLQLVIFTFLFVSVFLDKDFSLIGFNRDALIFSATILSVTLLAGTMLFIHDMPMMSRIKLEMFFPFVLGEILLLAGAIQPRMSS